MPEACLDEVVRFAFFQFLFPRKVHDQNEIGWNWVAIPKDGTIAVTPLSRHWSGIVVPDHVQMEPVVKVRFSQCFGPDQLEVRINSIVLPPGRKISADRYGESGRILRFVLEVVQHFETEIATACFVS